MSAALRPSRTTAVLTYVLLAVAAAVLLFPVVFTLVGSFLPKSELVSYPPRLTSGAWTTANYEGVVHSVPLLRQYLNSLLVSGLIMVGHLVTATLSAYAFVFLRVPGRRPLFWLFLSTMMIPWEAIVIPNYLLVVSLGLASSYPALVLPFLANGFGTFLMRQAFLRFPSQLRDAATIDGCGHLRFLLTILVPMSKPVLAALAVWAFLSGWNQFLWPLLVSNSSPELYTLQIGINYLRAVDTNQPGQVLAGITLALVPTLLLVLVGQRWLVRGFTAGAVK
ncbi:carbohydrate ABC transporter permease [Actinoalloteichus spitiensis]|uniref:carbohydrate ABC transporter permease n=1 Tax=Actinoalloteichus spitiensis TaxID=252394 RepID=UPI0002EF3B8E|nr:carbohydrate ABC transporter permease [Actinoalloteichus spitiensis]